MHRFLEVQAECPQGADDHVRAYARVLGNIPVGVGDDLVGTVVGGGHSYLFARLGGQRGVVRHQERGTGEEQERESGGKFHRSLLRELQKCAEGQTKLAKPMSGLRCKPSKLTFFVSLWARWRASERVSPCATTASTRPPLVS